MTNWPLVLKRSPSTTRRWLPIGLFALAANGCDGLDGNGDREEELRRFNLGFSRVECEGPLDVRISQGDEHDVRVTIDSNLMSHVETRIADETLIIDLDVEVDELMPGPHVWVTLPVLDSVALDGSGDVDVGPIEQESGVGLLLDGSGDLSFEGIITRLDAALNGSGAMQLTGAADDVAFSLNGSGGLEAQSFSADTGTLSLNGSGRLEATITERASVSLTGSGSIELYGGATVGPVSVTGSGQLKRH